ncbi:MAG: hypothetical protein QMD92_06810 [bacterium]|nr:hypothetical protein [bacterium]
MVEEKKDRGKKEELEEMDSLMEGMDKDNNFKNNHPEINGEDKEISSLEKREDSEKEIEAPGETDNNDFEKELFEDSEEISPEKEKTTEDIIDQELFALEKEIIPFEEEESLETLEEIKPEVAVEEIIKKKEIIIPPKRKKIYLREITTKFKNIYKNKTLMRIIYLFICIVMIIAVSFHIINRYIQAKSYLYKGILAIEKKDFKSAEENLKKSLKYTYAKEKVYHKFAQSYAPVNPQKAISLLETALKKEPKSLILLKNLLIIYGNIDDLGGAKKVYDKIIAINSKNVEAMVSLGWIYFNRGDIEEASLECEKALSIKYNHLGSLFLMQSILMKKKMYKAAVGVHRFIYKITDEKQCNPDILYKLGRYYLKKDRKDLAEEFFKTTVKHAHGYIEAHYYLGTLFYEKGMINRSAAEFQFVINKNPKHANAHNYLGLIYYEKNMMEKALVRFNDCLQLDPLHKQAIYNIANVYFYYIDDLKECINLYSKAFKLGIDTPLLHYNLGVSYYKNRMYKEAMQEWKKLLPEEANNPIVNFNLGTVNLQLDRLDESKEKLSRSLEFFWKNLRKARKKDTSEEEEIYLNMSKIHNNQGIIYEVFDKKREAMSSYSQSIEFASWAKRKNKVAYDNLQRLLHGIPITNIHDNINDDLSKIYTKKQIKEKPDYYKQVITDKVYTYTICFLIALFVFRGYKLLIKKKSIFDLIYEFYKKTAKRI